MSRRNIRFTTLEVRKVSVGRPSPVSKGDRCDRSQTQFSRYQEWVEGLWSREITSGMRLIRNFRGSCKGGVTEM